MKRSYHTLANRGKMNERQLAAYLSKNGQQLLPMVELIEQSHLAIEELIDAVGRVTFKPCWRCRRRRWPGRRSKAGRVPERSSGTASRAAACT